MSGNQDRYQIIETLGAGATSRVDKARDTLIGRVVALKTLLHGLGSADVEKQFLREAQIVGSLAHSHIVNLYDVGFAGNGMPCLVMEYVEGKTLEQCLEAGAALPLKRAAVWAGDLATALGVAHQAGIIHGDVKPANVLITHEGKVKLGDFGVARFATQSSGSANVMGTPAYLSPEQILGQTQDTRSDLFSLGIILYEMATGVRPFQGDSIVEVGGQILSCFPPPPSHHNPELPPEFDRIVMRCLSKDPAERYATAEALSTLLYPFARSETPKAKNETEPSIWNLLDAARSLRASVRRDFDHASTEITLLCTRAVHRTDSKLAAFAIIIAVLLFPLCRAVLSHSKMQPVTTDVASPVVWSTDAGGIRPPASTGTVHIANESVINLAEMNLSAVSEPANAHAFYPSAEADPRLTVKHAVIRKSVLPKSATPRITESGASNSPVFTTEEPISAEALQSPDEPTRAQETLLNVAIVSALGEGTVAVLFDNRQLLTTGLEPEHIGDTLRYDCPIDAGQHSIRVVLYRGNRTVFMEKQKGSDFRVGTSNSMQVRISRRSKLFVKHETTLEVTWPIHSVAPVSAANSDYARSLR